MSGRVLWLNGHPTAGKTWFGDYLERYHGFIHVDGDQFQLLYDAGSGIGDARYQTEVEGLYAYFEALLGGASTEELTPLLEAAKPYHQLVVDEALIRREKNNSDVVVVMAAYTREVRDVIREMFASGGVSDVTFLGLTVTAEENAERALPRIRQFCNANDWTLQQFWEVRLKKLNPNIHNFEGETTLLKALAQPERISKFEASDDHVAIIPTGGDRSLLPGLVEATLGLSPHTGEVHTNELCQKNYDRYAEYAAEKKRRHELRQDPRTDEALL